ncbi:MAG: discoidin domain-containing protein [Ruminococcaceae bacterium]|nr:discoidin domain-containing protein [Oscillospiraceae bacterium]
MKSRKSAFLRNIAWFLLASMLFVLVGCSQEPIIQPEAPTEPTEPPVFIEPPMPQREVLLKNYTVLGEWANSRVTATGEDGAKGPARSQDFNPYTDWNPQALPNFAGDPGIMYELDRAYDLNKFVFTMNDTYYFDLYVSADGENETFVARITKENADLAFVEGICTLDGLQLKDIRFVRLMFTGRASNNLWVSVKEVEFFETGATDVDTSWMIPGSEPPVTEPPVTEPPVTEPPVTEPPATKLEITDYKVTGTFRNSRVWDDGNSDASYGPHLTFDGKASTFWNPCAEDQYVGEPGIIYTLNGWYDLTKIELTFSKPDMSFVVYGSSHGEIYTELTRVDSENIDTAYTENTALLDLAGEGIRYVKIILTGRPANQLWISLYEVTLSGDAVEEPEYVAPPATEPPVTEPAVTEPPVPTEPDSTKNAVISGYQLTGEFSQTRIWDDGTEDAKIGPSKSFDGDAATQWNPTAKSGYTGDPGIIYTLDGAYNLTALQMNTSTKKMYFKVYGSTDGVEFNELGLVNKDNAADLYSGSVATVNLSGAEANFVKIVFTGREDNGPWVTCNEVYLMGTAAA